MKAPRKKRSRRRELVQNVDRQTLAELAGKARYIGSPEHKETPSFAGQPKPRADASRCPNELAWEKEAVEKWLQEAIQNGQIGEPWEGEFPRYVWHRVGDTVYEGRLVNRTLGHYKGYPLSPEEKPLGWKD